MKTGAVNEHAGSYILGAESYCHFISLYRVDVVEGNGTAPAIVR